jgi:hypothetical protein
VIRPGEKKVKMENESGDIIRLTCQEILPPKIDSLPLLRNPPSMNNYQEIKKVPCKTQIK